MVRIRTVCDPVVRFTCAPTDTFQVVSWNQTDIGTLRTVFKESLLRRYFKRLIPKKHREVSLLGRLMWMSPRDDFNLYRLHLAERYTPSHHEIAKLLPLLGLIQRGCTFVDVGANIGLYTVVFSAVGAIGGFEVIAIEPNPVCVDRLKRNLKAYTGTRVVEVACSNRSGKALMQVYDNTQVGHIAPGGANTSQTINVEVNTLDNICRDIRGDLVIKIDCEGHESEIIEGMSEILASRKVLAMMIDGTGSVNRSTLSKYGYVSYEAASLKPENEAYALLFVRDDAQTTTQV